MGRTEQGKENKRKCSLKWYQDNKDKILEQKKEYYEANKDKILEKRKLKIICECGGKYSYQHKTRHQRTQKHISWTEKTA